MDNRGMSHPLDIFIGNKNLYLLEAMVPLVPIPYRKPLIMFIKYKELVDILNNVERVSNTLGNIPNISSSDDMFNYMSSFLPNDMLSNINMLKTAMAMTDINNMADTATDPSSNSLYDSILSIINQGDDSNEQF